MLNFKKMFERKQGLNAGVVAVISSLVSVVVLMVVLGLISSFSADIVDEIQDDQAANSYAYNITGDTLEGINTLTEKQDTIASVVVVGVIIAILFAAFGAFIALRR